MKDYYTNKCKEYNKNTKQLWQVINNIVGKTKHSGRIIPFISVNRVKMYDTKKIADEFGSCYANMGTNLAQKIPRSDKRTNEYISKIPRPLNSLSVQRVGFVEIKQVIKALPSKTRSGHDKLNNIVPKYLIEAISYLLSIIFNQSFSSGIFPEKMKIAEIVPLYKGKEDDLVINY